VDGPVLSAGGGLASAYNEPISLPGGNFNPCSGHKDAEIYSPPYLFNGDGTQAFLPAITSSPAFIAYGADRDYRDFLSSVTHSFNM